MSGVSNKLLLAGIISLLAACSGARHMMPTPNIYHGHQGDLYEGLSPELQKTQVRLFYVTDRVPEHDEDGKLVYGYGRSESLAFGTAQVDLGADTSWEQLVEASRTQQRFDPVELKLLDVQEIARSPDFPLPFKEVDGVIIEEPELREDAEKARAVFRAAIVNQLELTPRKDVYIYVHGFHNNFDDAAFAMAELWHFLGRAGVPIIYTWPAGHPGLFGYTYDRESSEFTVYHFRLVIKFLAGFPEVENINIIAHSRGTDVAVTALRELTIEARAAGHNPRVALKIHNFVMAAPDLDLQVAVQRVGGDHLAYSVDRFTIYSSPKDRAIGWAAWLYDSPKGRVGTLGKADVPPNLRRAFEYGNKSIAVINFSKAAQKTDSKLDSFGHSYFRNAPTVSSDLILMLRYDLDPGPPGRPLEFLGGRFWSIPGGYPGNYVLPE
jgi:esterase/lipase superfamily enzyme